jgi:hypothetical protein
MHWMILDQLRSGQWTSAVLLPVFLPAHSNAAILFDIDNFQRRIASHPAHVDHSVPRHGNLYVQPVEQQPVEEHPYTSDS